jgi:hypothetical protein
MDPRISDITRIIGVFDFAGFGGSGGLIVTGLNAITGVPDSIEVITRVAFSTEVATRSVLSITVFSAPFISASSARASVKILPETTFIIEDNCSLYCSSESGESVTRRSSLPDKS